MSARRLVCVGLLLAAFSARAEAPFDHSKTRFPLLGQHQDASCESCHPARGATRKWKGVPLDCHGCHGDSQNHRGALGSQCQLCHDATGWKSIRHTAPQHRFKLTGKHDLPCASCHAGGAHLKPTVTCADCHRQPHGGTRAPCDTCHPVDNWKPVFFKQHTYDPALLPGKHLTATCLGCHPAFRFKGTTTECESCHLTKPHGDIGRCRDCHSPLSWKDVAPDRRNTVPSSVTQPGVAQPAIAPTTGARTDIYRVRNFNHVAHERQVKARGQSANCNACHAGGDRTKRPTMQSCEGCHDGKSAFDARGTHCDRCHQAPAGTVSTELPPPSRTFLHESHAKHGVDIEACTACHGVGVSPDKVRAGRNEHRPCQGCHAAAFRTAGQSICLVCHVRNDPFRPNPLRPPPEKLDEFRSPDAADIDHAAHIAARVECKTCHLKEAGLPPRSATIGHSICAPCHVEPSTLARNVAAKGTPVTLDRCGACHVLASVPRQGGGKREWSTRDHFRHDKDHRACLPCHLPNGASDLEPPTMQYCATCHNGRTAFNTIDRKGCYRCHDLAVRFPS